MRSNRRNHQGLATPKAGPDHRCHTHTGTIAIMQTVRDRPMQRMHPGHPAVPVGEPFREWVAPLELARACAPASESDDDDLKLGVDEWIGAVRRHGIRSVLCLLSERELAWFENVPGGLLGRYRQRGLQAVSVPVVPDRDPVLTEAERRAILTAYEDLEKPLVVHCLFGQIRSGEAVRFLERRFSEASTRAPSDSQHREILRLIRNSHADHTRCCAIRRGRSGLADYGRLGALLPEVNREHLAQYLDEIDEVRASHARCPICRLKFLAFCRLFSAGRLPARHRAYAAEFQERRPDGPAERNFMAEARKAIRQARKAVPRPLHGVRYFHGMADQPGGAPEGG